MNITHTHFLSNTPESAILSMFLIFSWFFPLVYFRKIYYLFSFHFPLLKHVWLFTHTFLKLRTFSCVDEAVSQSRCSRDSSTISVMYTWDTRMAEVLNAEYQLTIGGKHSGQIIAFVRKTFSPLAKVWDISFTTQIFAFGDMASGLREPSNKINQYSDAWLVLNCNHHDHKEIKLIPQYVIEYVIMSPCIVKLV